MELILLLILSATLGELTAWAFGPVQEADAVAEEADAVAEANRYAGG